MDHPLDKFLPPVSKIITEENSSVDTNIVNYSHPLDKFLPSIEPKKEEKGLLNNFTRGLIRGAVDVLSTAGKGVGYLDKLLLPGGEERNKIYNEEIEKNRKAYEAEYGESTAANIGRVGGQIAATLPVMSASLPTKGIMAAAGALPTISTTGARVAAPIANRLIGSAGVGAAGGAEFGGLTSAANDKSIAENVGEGAITGAVAGPVLTGVGAVAKGLGRSVVGKVSQSTAELAKRAEELGIRITAPQMGGPFIKKFEQMTGMLPFSGKAKLNEQQTSQFNRAVSRTFGEDVDELSPEIVEAARKKIGDRIGSIAEGVTIKADENLHKDFLTILHDADKVLTEDELRPIFKQMLNIAEKIDENGNISGKAYQSLVSHKGVLNKAQGSQNPNIRNFANEIRYAFDDALERSAPPEVKQSLSDVKRQYKSVKTVEDLVSRDPEGNVSPIKLMSKVLQSPGGKLRSGELGELADIGRKFFPTPPESGTPLGTEILQRILPTSGIAGAFHFGLPSISSLAATSAETAATLAVLKVARTGLNSKKLASTLVKMGQGHTSGKFDVVTEKLLPYSSIGYKAIQNNEKKIKLPINLQKD